MQTQTKNILISRGDHVHADSAFCFFAKSPMQSHLASPYGIHFYAKPSRLTAKPSSLAFMYFYAKSISHANPAIQLA
ncbi:hypothetical protein ACLB2K_066371 [Fragaria x ananassa]